MRDEGPGLPKYGRIVATLQAEIEDGLLAVGSLLPSEGDLARQFGVSRMTVRQAHTVLDRLGLIERRHGVGTVVLNNRIRRSIGSLTGFAEDVAVAGHRPGARLLGFTREPADRVVGEALGLRDGGLIVKFNRLRTADGEPIGLQEARVPHYLLPGLKAEDLEDASFYQLVERRFGLKIDWAQQRMHVRLPTPKEASLLEMPPSVPVWAVERLTRLSDGRPVELLEALYRGDRVSYSTRLVRATEAGPPPDERAVFLVHMPSEGGDRRTS